MEAQESGVEQLVQMIFIDTSASSSVGADLHNVRMLLEKVLKTHDNDVAKAMRWLMANNNALDGESPVTMIRQGQIQRLKDFWRECEKRYVD